ncbi:MAG: TylF/MycF/NovP-related O-methyltransferase [Candidatus Saccharibacteria bacterium]|nr:TylF/MycF/NovP-related O-methyltransferase [Candidatus Saccharibacteria bacterium]
MVWNNDQVSRKETECIIEEAKNCLNLSGDFVELGCYKGDTSLLLAEVLKGSDKKLWIYDSFEGLPEKTSEDISLLGQNFKRGELLVSKREVKERFLRAGLKVPIIKKGWFKDFSSDDLPEKIAFCFLDGDFYESIRDGLKLIENKMVKDGVLIVHDYNNPALPGVSRAVDEWASLDMIMHLESMAILRW